ncbi:MAG TPA: hypothetical protein VHQ65_14590 [Thermoanaerobaculia bacterium]|nr:hypothetical protein [Thermoanaerobaculia bacterium]
MLVPRPLAASPFAAVLIPAAVLAATLAASPPAAGQPAFGPEVTVVEGSPATGITVSDPAVTLDADGRVLLAWQRREARELASPVLDVHGRLFGADDVGGPERELAASRFDETSPFLAGDGRGTNLLVFHRADFDHPPGCATASFGEVLHRVLDGDEPVSSGEVNQNAGGGRSPAAAMSPLGEFVVAYESNACPGLGVEAGTKLRRFPGPRTALDGLYSEQPLAVAINSAGSTAVAIAHPAASGVCDTAQPCLFTVQRFAANGDALRPIVFDSYANTGLVTTFAPAVALQEDGSTVVAWVRFDFTTPEVLSVVGQRFDPRGEPRGDELEISAGVVPPDSQSFEPPAIALAVDGSFAVAFTVGDAAYVRLYDAAARPLGPPLRVTERAVEKLALARNPAGDVVVAYATGDAIRYRRLAAGPCAGSTTDLCLGGGRFRVGARWRTRDGDVGAGQARMLTADTGYFWFFDSANVEVVVKVLDACAAFDRHWVFASGLTNVEVELEVEDVLSGEIRRYVNPLGHPFEPIQDTGAFATCP